MGVISGAGRFVGDLLTGGMFSARKAAKKVKKEAKAAEAEASEAQEKERIRRRNLQRAALQSQPTLFDLLSGPGV